LTLFDLIHLIVSNGETLQQQQQQQPLLLKKKKKKNKNRKVDNSVSAGHTVRSEENPGLKVLGV
jgi:hypothetical protein